MFMVNFMVTLLHGGYTCFMIDFMLCTVQIIVFLNIVSAKLLSMIYICWIWGKVGFCEMFLNGETLKEWTGGFERRNLFK